MYILYRLLTLLCGPLIFPLLRLRQKHEKETERSIDEKRALAFTKTRSVDIKTLLWIHGASVGEAQSSLTLIEYLLDTYPDLHIMVTTGTLTSATLMEERLPERAFHQFCPLDHPAFIERFLNHWHPDAALWIESELWPNTLHAIKDHAIPAILLNAHMSPSSYKTWRILRPLAKTTLSVFNKVLCQTKTDKDHFNALGAKHCIVTDNIKYSATPLHVSTNDLITLQKAIAERPIWLYASTHDPEEEIACRTHEKLKKDIPNLLTLIVPRHPQRRNEIAINCAAYPLRLSFRGENKSLPHKEDDIYIADTLGELGLFYTISPIACIGRSLSKDGGGGHNPIEAAQLGCAVLHGTHVQNLRDIYTEMHKKHACLSIKNETDLERTLSTLLRNKNSCAILQQAALSFAKEKTDVLKHIMKEITPLLDSLLEK